MKNLKQVLALGMAFSLTMSSMAGAAFTDSADIKATEAVNMLSALGVIKGYEDGSFKPEGTVTRAEAAKMIYTIRNGGNDDASAWAGTPTSFTDLNGYGWAEGYIKYCQTMGIIAGKSATSFAPGDKVTGVELAKMVLVTLGYNAETAGLTGASWSNKTLALASENGLLDDVASNLSAGLPRQYAAQILYNGVNADIVTYENGQYKKVETTKSEQYLAVDKNNNGQYDAADDQIGYRDVVTNKTLGSAYMDLETTTVMTLKEVQYDSVKGTYTLVCTGGTNYTNVTEDYSALVGQKVNVLHKKEKADAVYGVYAHKDSKVVLETVVGKVETVSSDTSAIKVDGKTYKTGAAISAISVYGYNNDVSGTAYTQSNVNDMISTTNNEYTVKFIDNSGDGKIDLAVVNPVTVAKVTYVNNDSFNTSVSIDSTSTFKKEDVVVYDGIAKDDYVAVSAKVNTVEDKTTFKKLDTVSGKVEGIKNTSDLKINGVWYEKATTTLAGSATPTLDDTVTLVMLNGYYVHANIDSNASTDLVYISANAAKDTLTNTVKASAVFADGTTSIVEISELNGNKGNSLSASTDVMKGKFYTYTKLSDGKYDMDVVTTSNKAGYDAYASGVSFVLKGNNTAATLGGQNIADDAVMFVQDNDGKVTVMTGKQVNGWKSGTVTSASMFTKVVNGVSYVKAGVLVLNSSVPGSYSSDMYGYVIDKPVYTGNIDGSVYTYYTVWNGSGEPVEVHESGNQAANRTAGTIIKYNLDDKNEVTNVVKVSTDNSAAYGSVNALASAVLGINGDVVTLKGAVTVDVKKNADTKIVYVNTKDNVVANGTDIPLATETSTAGTYDQNVVALYDTSDNTLLAIFVDVSNKLDGTGITAADTAATKTTITGMNSIGDTTNFKDITASIGDGTAVAASNTVAEGTPITITAKGKATGSVKLNIKIGSTVVAVINENKDPVVSEQGYSVTFTASTSATGALTVEEAS